MSLNSIFSKPPKGGEETNVAEEKVMKAITNDEALSKAYEAWAGKVDKKGINMQEKFKQAVKAYPGQPIGYNSMDESFVPQQYQGFN